MHWTNDAVSTPHVCNFIDSLDSSDITFADTVYLGASPDNWKQELGVGSATSTLIGVKAIVKMPFGTASWYANSATTFCFNGSGHGQITGMKLSLNDPGAGADDVASSRARAKLLGDYINAVNTWRGGNFLAEIKESTEQFLHPVHSIYNRTWEFAGIVRGLRRFRRNPLVYGKALADAWLAFVFGIKPLIQDANDANAALVRLGSGVDANADRLKLRGSSRNTKILSVVTEQITPTGWAGDTWSSVITTKSDFKVRYKGMLVARPNGDAFYPVEFGVDLSDYLPAVWEGIPWSFFIDYFVNVQEMLDGLKVVDAALARLDLCVRNAGIVQVGVPFKSTTGAPFTTSVSCGASHSLVVRVSRQVVNEIPYVGFRFKFPGLNSPKWLNIAALARQIAGSKPLKWTTAL
jgi:hypothetical protein